MQEWQFENFGACRELKFHRARSLKRSRVRPSSSSDFRSGSQAEVKRHAITSTTLNDIVQSLLDEVSDYRHGAFRCIGDRRQLGNRSN
jgi:hypothetical protein